MRHFGRQLFLISLATLVVVPAWADWEPEDGHKMHFPQLPNPVGWDVRDTFTPSVPPDQPAGNIKILADDFLCTQSGAITDIHLWGSWRGEIPHEGLPNNIHVEIWDDDRSGEFSHPGQRVWGGDFPLGSFVEVIWGEGLQGWHDPNTGEYLPDDHFLIWQYNITQIPEPFIQEQGHIYWLVVYFEVGIPDPMMVYQYGWKTSLDHFEDAAVWTDDLTAEPVVWTPLVEPDGTLIDLAFVITGEGEGPELDFGDAPDQPYPTYLANDGARHPLRSSGPILGAAFDTEYDGQPNGSATGDDSTGVPDDEDGIAFTTGLVPGQSAKVNVTVSGPCRLDAWLDFNGNGSWADPGEQIFTSQTLASAGTHSLSFSVPASAQLGNTFARFRVSSAGGLSYTGFAADGEVEDERVLIEEEVPVLDFGDAPDPTYPTLLANDGARHLMGQSPMLGSVIDAEFDGQPNAAATGDDSTGVPDDEDGVLFLSPLVPGARAGIRVTVNAACVLNAWLDFGGDGGWAEPGDHFIVDQALSAGMHTIGFDVPATAALGATFARFRVDTAGGLLFTGLAADGEVEDYGVTITEEFGDIDFGDLPDPSYRSLLASDGARHMMSGAASPLFLGFAIDAELDAKPTILADGDDLNGSSDDEDGVSLPPSLIPGTLAPVGVTASAPSFLDAWVDWDQSGVLGDQANELVFVAQPLATGPNSLAITVPPGLGDRVTYARFRQSSMGGLGPNGLAVDGEVEDYMVVVAEQGDEVGDLGDAPDPPYPTKRPPGAFHTAGSQLYLGRLLDLELDGQPDANATGDDLVFLDDGDGVTLTTSVVPAGSAGVDVVASGVGLLDAWVDFNGDGDWDDAGEQIFVGTSLVPGLNSLHFAVPPDAVAGTTYARFRFSSGPPLLPTGSAVDGEVEDIKLTVGEAYLDFGDAPDPDYPTLLANDGARHVIPPPGQELVYLGSLVDSETDGQQNADATGDDADGSDDEDGVVFSDFLGPGKAITVTVTASTAGYLNAWIDYNGDGDWDDAGEQALTDEALSSGANVLALTPPTGAEIPTTMARFRFTSFTGASVSLDATGLALDGEVEDYQVDGSQIFNDGFESSDTTEWSTTFP